MNFLRFPTLDCGDFQMTHGSYETTWPSEAWARPPSGFTNGFHISINIHPDEKRKGPKISIFFRCQAFPAKENNYTRLFLGAWRRMSRNAPMHYICNTFGAQFKSCANIYRPSSPAGPIQRLPVLSAMTMYSRDIKEETLITRNP